MNDYHGKGLISPSTSIGGDNNTCSTSPANSETSIPSRKYFFPSSHAEPSTSAAALTSTGLFGLRKKTSMQFGGTARKTSIGVIGRSCSSGTSKNGSEESPKRKKSIAATGAAAKKTMRKRFSQAKLALRKISHSSTHSHKCGSNTSMSPVSMLESPTDKRSLDSPSVAGHDISPSNSLGAPDENTAPVHKKGFFFPKFRKLSSTTPPLPSTSLIPSIAALKKPLGPSLSWDPEQRSRSPSTSSRSRIHSEGNEDGKRRRKSRGSILITNPDEANDLVNYAFDSRRSSKGIIDPDRLDLENTCLHCSLGTEYRRNRLRLEIETAVKRLAKRLGNRTANWPRSDDSHNTLTNSTVSVNTPQSPTYAQAEQLRRTMGTPDIVVSSISSDEENDQKRNTSSEMCSSYPTSGETSSACTTASPSPLALRNKNDIFFNTDSMQPPTEDADNETEKSPTYTHPPLQAMDTLKPPGFCQNNNFLSPSDCSSPPRSNSVDLSTLRRDIELWSISSGDVSENGSDTGEGDPATPAESIKTTRSRSHDPSHSPDHLLRRPSRIEHLSEIFRKALAKSPVVKRAAALQDNEQKSVSKHRTSRYWLDDNLMAAEHIWIPSSGPGSASTSTDTECYIGEKDCEKVGEKRRCAACHIVAHTACFPLLAKMNLVCKTTFRDSALKRNPSKDIWDSLTKHHWVHRWKMEGRCQQCHKSFQQKMFREKEVIAITCSWCKLSYHNKRSCFSLQRFEEKCDRGALRDMILPPSWLLRLSHQRKRHGKSMKKPARRKYRPFIVKPMDASIAGPSQPLLVFVNPKSGGNKGSKALHTLCWLLNPRQVFDITALKGPKYGLEMFRKVGTQLRILVCGGDGTVGWVLSTLDQLNWAAYPPMALMPLGTGNDLSRCMGWGGMFSDEPLAELLNAVMHETSVTYLDRWKLDVTPNNNQYVTDNSHDDPQLNDALQSALPLTVMNNYFSIGADAHVALQFHHSRSANPQMLNSRFKNRIAYGGLGTIDLFKRTWKDLSEFITIECDGVDITHKIREFKFHCVLFHNISYYAGGTIPWGSDSNEEWLKPSSCDGKIEVLGFTTATLAALQMGGKGERIAQCSKVRVVTLKPIPMQVDGEPCLLAPSIIKMNFHSKVPMLKRDKKVVCTPAVTRKAVRNSRSGLDSATANTSVFMHVPVIVVGRHDYDMYRDSIDRLKDTGFEIGVISLEAETELSYARNTIQKLLCEHPMLPYEPGPDWRFLDYVSNSEEGTFRISRHQEHNHSISDVCNLDECIILLDDAFPSMTARSSAIGHDLVFTPSKVTVPTTISYDPGKPVTPNTLSQRRISETLRIVLSSDAQETHL
ncbi:unnamed protein product [Bursaphelenchus xylophilus]|uniref:Diacylglycerol kinase n=1 Tax=Bursaphelenchus xylophilus TaxID=6326 RepID=A0A1I7RPR0_BURXY|nr:unnamed protein product [Bursaphelenchus xylophilus]CAG9096469.1 unnamed protein product [Bursaphelenchus xylophilus]